LKYPSTIAFDLDQTLINTLPSIFSALNLTFDFFGLDLQNEQFVKERIGLPVSSLFAHLGLPHDVVEDLIGKFREILRDNLSSKDDVYPGVIELLNILVESDSKVAIATSKPTELTILTLQNAGLLDFFDVVVGTDNGFHKPNPWVLEEIMRRMNLKLDLFVGDRLEDAGAAAAVSVPFVALLHSIHTREDFSKFKPAGMFDSFLAFKSELVGH
jgi:phosphoglycolate phosphatase